MQERDPESGRGFGHMPGPVTVHLNRQRFFRFGKSNTLVPPIA